MGVQTDRANITPHHHAERRERERRKEREMCVRLRNVQMKGTGEVRDTEESE